MELIMDDSSKPQHHRSKHLAHSLTLRPPVNSTERLTRFISNARVGPNPHQVDAAMFAFQSPPSKGAILADEGDCTNNLTTPSSTHDEPPHRRHQHERAMGAKEVKGSTLNKTLVLVPGLLCTERLWRAQVEHLQDDLDIIIADVSQDDSVAGIARRLLDDAPETFCLAGLSMGGYISLEVMRQAPERVERLALLDTSARPDSEEQTELRLDLVKQAKREGIAPVAHGLLARLVHESRAEDGDVVSAVVEMAEDTGVEIFERQENTIINRPNSRPDLPGIACPTLVLCGREDAITPLEAHEELTHNIPDSELRIVERCGHLSTLERPGEVSEMLRSWFVR
ncbi:MAG: alpha/beta fold hydrolase [Rubrobacter sp.]